MIEYKRGGRWHILNLFLCKGSLFPVSLIYALPITALTAFIKSQNFFPDDSVLLNNTAWSGFSFLVGFLVVFRTSQAYSRFWDGCTATHQMRAEWVDAASALIAFTKHSKEPEAKLLRFRHTMVRLFSVLHAMALGEIEECENLEDVMAFDLELIDPCGIDRESWVALSKCHRKVELVFQWIQAHIVLNISEGVLSIPPPILSRVFQELANGMVQLHEAQKISCIPFPFPYAQTCDMLLVMHWLITPMITAQWASNIIWACIFSFIQVFILWSLNNIAVEIEHPFGDDANDLDAAQMQLDMNMSLLLLLHPACARVPKLTPEAKIEGLHELGRRASMRAKIPTESATASSQWGRATFNRAVTVSHSVLTTQSSTSNGFLGQESEPHNRTWCSCCCSWRRRAPPDSLGGHLGSQGVSSYQSSIQGSQASAMNSGRSDASGVKLFPRKSLAAMSSKETDEVILFITDVGPADLISNEGQSHAGCLSRSYTQGTEGGLDDEGHAPLGSPRSPRCPSNFSPRSARDRSDRDERSPRVGHIDSTPSATPLARVVGQSQLVSRDKPAVPSKVKSSHPPSNGFGGHVNNHHDPRAPRELAQSSSVDPSNPCPIAAIHSSSGGRGPRVDAGGTPHREEDTASSTSRSRGLAQAQDPDAVLDATAPSRSHPAGPGQQLTSASGGQDERLGLGVGAEGTLSDSMVDSQGGGSSKTMSEVWQRRQAEELELAPPIVLGGGKTVPKLQLQSGPPKPSRPG